MTSRFSQNIKYYLRVTLLPCQVNCVFPFLSNFKFPFDDNIVMLNIDFIQSYLIEFTHRFSTSSVVGSAAGSNHVKMWTAERVVAILNIPALALPFVITTPLTDAIFCTVLVVHFHWGKFFASKFIFHCKLKMVSLLSFATLNDNVHCIHYISYFY